MSRGYNFDDADFTASDLYNFAQRYAADAITRAESCRHLSNLVREMLGDGRTLACRRIGTSIWWMVDHLKDEEAPWLEPQFWLDPTVENLHNDMVSAAANALALHQIQTKKPEDLLEELRLRREVEDRENDEQRELLAKTSTIGEEEVDKSLGCLGISDFPEDDAELDDRTELTLMMLIERDRKKKNREARLFASFLRAATKLLGIKDGYLHYSRSDNGRFVTRSTVPNEHDLPDGADFSFLMKALRDHIDAVMANTKADE